MDTHIGGGAALSQQALSQQALSQTVSFDLRLLGQFELVHRNSGERISVPAGRTRALIAYLGAAPRFTETRRRLTDLLWDADSDAHALQNMRQFRLNLRRNLDPRAAAFILFDKTSISLDPSAASRGNISSAV